LVIYNLSSDCCVAKQDDMARTAFCVLAQTPRVTVRPEWRCRHTSCVGVGLEVLAAQTSPRASASESTRCSSEARRSFRFRKRPVTVAERVPGALDAERADDCVPYRADQNMKNDKYPWLRKIATLIALVATMNLMIPALPASAADRLADLSSVLGELRKGGFIIYFRHGPTDQTGSSDEAADLMKCETQRNLSAEGRQQVTQIGKAFQALNIPVGMVTTSPFCRCKDTAKLAFDRFTVSNDLYFAIGTDASETKRYTESLRRMLSTPPAKATNAVIVSHTANLREAAGIWPKPEGVAYVFRPLPGGEFEAIAMVLPEDWGKLAELKSSSRSK
jgi:phosphohistidine phosphatase SixA